jgi:hypothetical protein
MDQQAAVSGLPPLSGASAIARRGGPFKETFRCVDFRYSLSPPF